MRAVRGFLAVLSDDGGLSMLEVLMAVVLGTMVILAVSALWSATARFSAQTAKSSQALAAAANVYWIVDRLAQSATAVGYQNANRAFVDGSSNGPVPVLALKMSSLAGVSPLDGIAPPNSPVVQETTGGGTDWLCLAVVPVGSISQLALFPGGDPYNPAASPPVYPPAADVTPIGSPTVNYQGTMFAVLPAASSTAPPDAFQMQLVETRADSVGRGGAAPRPTTATYPFLLGKEGY